MHKSFLYYFLTGAMFAIVFAGISCSNAAEVSNPPNSIAPIQQSKSVVSRDNTEYPKVQIGGQIWMAKNLNVLHFKNGDTIPATISDQQWAAAGQNGTPVLICPYNSCTSIVDPQNKTVG